MAVAVAIGLNSDVTLPSGHNARITGGTITVSQAEIDTTSTTDAGSATCLGGVKIARGVARAYPKFGGANTAPGWSTISTTPAAMTVTVASGCTYTFSALIYNISHSFDYMGKAVITFSYRSSGTVTETWA